MFTDARMEEGEAFDPLHEFPDPVAVLVQKVLCPLEIVSVEAVFHEFQFFEPSNLVHLELPSQSLPSDANS